MKLFVGTIVMENVRGLNIQQIVIPQWLLFETKDEAKGKAVSLAHERYPTSQGWRISYVDIIEMSPESVRRVADAVCGESKGIGGDSSCRDKAWQEAIRQAIKPECEPFEIHPETVGECIRDIRERSESRGYNRGRQDGFVVGVKDERRECVSICDGLRGVNVGPAEISKLIRERKS